MPQFRFIVPAVLGASLLACGTPSSESGLASSGSSFDFGCSRINITGCNGSYYLFQCGNHEYFEMCSEDTPHSDPYTYATSKCSTRQGLGSKKCYIYHWSDVVRFGSPCRTDKVIENATSCTRLCPTCGIP